MSASVCAPDSRAVTHTIIRDLYRPRAEASHPLDGGGSRTGRGDKSPIHAIALHKCLVHLDTKTRGFG